jgi:hypothetical protein
MDICILVVVYYGEWIYLLGKSCLSSSGLCCHEFDYLCIVHMKCVPSVTVGFKLTSSVMFFL